MITIFRSIRKALLADSKFSKYLVYALGEILLVVIGILLALQINTWSADKNARDKEQLYLKSFQNDIENNIAQLDRVINKSSETLGATDSLLRYAQGQLKLPTIEAFEALIMGATNYTIFMSQEGTINDIFGSGDLALIQNDSIRKAMVNWAADLKYLKEFETLGKDNQLRYIGHLLESAPMYRKTRQQNFVDQEVADQLLKDTQFLNLVSEQKHMAQELNWLYQNQRAKMETILEQVHQNIDTP